MTMTDPIADMLSRIRNGLSANKKTIDVPSSRVKKSILEVLQTEGYIRNFEAVEGAQHATIRVELKYSGGQSVISEISRISRPGLRRYTSCVDIPLVRNGLGIYIISTSHGVMTDTQAKDKKLGGEMLCQVF